MGRKTRYAFRSAPAEAGRREFILSGQPIEFALKRSAAARNCRLEFDLNSGLTVVVPHWYGDGALEDVLVAKRDWILTNYQHILARQLVVSQRRLRDGGPFLFVGREYTLRCQQCNGGHGAVHITGDDIVVDVPPGDPPALQAAVTAWLKRRARDIILPLVAEYAARMNVAYNRVFIRNQKTRWASCSNTRNLSFNFHLAMAPERIIRYLVVHELAHLKTLKHGKRFWGAVAKYYDDVKGAERWLRHNGDLLTF